MATSKPDIAKLVMQMPDSDRPGEASKFTGPDPKAAEQTYAEIISGGRDSLLDLIAMLRAPDDPEFKDFRPEYVLHGLAIYVGRSGKERQRKAFAQTLASQLGSKNRSKGVQRLLIRELQVAGGSEAVKALGKMLSDEELCEYAAQALAAIGDGAGRQLRGALSEAKGKRRVTIVQNLGVARDASSARALRDALADEDRDVRLAAAWSLAAIGDARSVDAVLKVADAEPGWGRIKATQACLLLAENLLAAGRKKDAARIYKHLRDSRTDPKEQYVRDAAAKALAAAETY